MAYRRPRPDAEGKLLLHNLQTHGEQIILESEVLWYEPIFDAAGQRLAYTTLTDLQDGSEEWAIHVRDIAAGAEAVFQSPVVHQGQPWDPLPGTPIGWVGDLLLLDLFVPYSEMPNRGIWTLDLGGAVPGETISLQGYDRLVLDPGDVDYMLPTMSPNGELLAFVVYEYGHRPTCAADSPDSGDVTGLGIVPTTGGLPHVLVDVASEDSALGDQPLTWSPDGSQILFARGSCQGASLLKPTLQTVNLQGAITREWPRAHQEDTCCQEALWCTPEQIYYLRGEKELWRLAAETGHTELVLSSAEIRLLGCLPAMDSGK